MSLEQTELIFYVDRCLGRSLATALEQAGQQVKYHDDEFPQNALDVDWLPLVGERGWIVLTKDSAMSRNASERLAITVAKVRLFALGRQDLRSEEMSALFLKAIRSIQHCVRNHPAPFIAKIDRNGKVTLWRDRDRLLQESQEHWRGNTP